MSRTSSRSGSASSVAWRSSRPANGCMRSVRCLSSPGVCGAAQQQHAQDGLLVGRDPERLVDEVAVLRRAAAAAARVADPAPAAEPLQRGAQRRLVVVDDRIAVRRLVAGESQRVERQRVLVGRRALLLQQAAEHALFGRGEVHSSGSLAGRCDAGGVSTPGPPVPLSDIVLAGNRMTLRERVLRVRRMAPRIAMIALATAIAYVIARYVFGHQRPFFAPVSAVVCIGATLGQPARRAVQLALGVSLGVLIADAAIALIGTGAWQLSVVVFVTMTRRRLRRRRAPRAATSRRRRRCCSRRSRCPGDEFGLSRAAMRRSARDRAGLQLRAVPGPPGEARPGRARARGAPDRGRARRGRRGARRAGRRERRHRAGSGARAGAPLRGHARRRRDERRDRQLALARRGHRGAVARYSAAVEDLTRAHTDVATLARGAKRLLDAGETAPAQVVEAVGDLAISARHVADAFGDPEVAARRAGVRAARGDGVDRGARPHAVALGGDDRRADADDRARPAASDGTQRRAGAQAGPARARPAAGARGFGSRRLRRHARRDDPRRRGARRRAPRSRARRRRGARPRPGGRPQRRRHAPARGAYPAPPGSPPDIPGLELAGEVRAPGPALRASPPATA